MPHHQVTSPHTGYANADTSDVISPGAAPPQQAECSPPTTGQPKAACKQSAQVYAWSVSNSPSQPHSYGVTQLMGNRPISRGKDRLLNKDPANDLLQSGEDEDRYLQLENLSRSSYFIYMPSKRIIFSKKKNYQN